MILNSKNGYLLRDSIVPTAFTTVVDNLINEAIKASNELSTLKPASDIIEKDGRYLAGSSSNFFFIFDAIAGVLKKWINR